MRPAILRSPGLLCLLTAVLVGGCRSDEPWVETDPDAFVARSPGDPWTPADARRRGEAPPERTGPRDERDVGPLARMESRMRPLPAGPEGSAGEDVSLLHLVEFALTNRPETRIAWELSLIHI